MFTIAEGISTNSEQGWEVAQQDGESSWNPVEGKWEL